MIDKMAGEIMSRDVICVPEEMDLRDLTKLFLQKGITGAPVVDRHGGVPASVEEHESGSDRGSHRYGQQGPEHDLRRPSAREVHCDQGREW